MLQYVLVPLVSLLASGLTLFSGFGLGTILLPVFAIFFPIDLAVAMTAVVHLLNNLFKVVLLGRNADKTAVVHFGIPAILAAFAGAVVLTSISDLPPVLSYNNGENELTPVKLIVAALMIVFALMEVVPRWNNIAFHRKYLPVGGLISGFFGGLSGHQGALRSAFLVRAGLTKETFIATGVVVACLIDLTRLTVYASHFTARGLTENFSLILTATVSAFLGAFLGTKLLKKVTLKTIRIIICILLFVLATLLATGIL